MADANIGKLSPDGLWRWDGTTWRSAAPGEPHPPLPLWAQVKLRAPATWQMMAVAVLVGLIADQALRTGTFGLGASLSLALIGIGLLFIGRVKTSTARGLTLGGLLFAIWLGIRASPWLLWPDLAASLVLFGLGASFASRGSLVDLGVAEMAARAFNAVIHGLAGSAFVLRPLIGARSRLASAAPMARGLLLATPIAIVIAGLLAAADPVFASFFNINVDLGQLSTDVVFVLGGSIVAAGLLRLASAAPMERVDGPRWRLGAIEGLIVLAVLDAIFAAFAVAQALAAFGAAGGTLRAAGVTYADYARSGFFQLLWVAGITAFVIVLFTRITWLSNERARRSFIVLSELGICLTLLIVFVAFRRLSLYEEAFGFTMLRLYSHIFAVWIALVFLLLAADIAGVHRSRRWFVGATFASIALVILALNLINPEALVVSMNVNHAATSHEVDTQYLAQLSSDATPNLIASRSQLEPGLSSQIARFACAGAKSYSPALAAFNWADANAAAARRQAC
ncbi:MAG: DUF4173 domain-containing protein [Chloroflexi bacterium]|nr:MAG: DUF4173 domain-containing protein [Chloroflexota bacterium]